jgi:hypothetical protein
MYIFYTSYIMSQPTLGDVVLTIINYFKSINPYMYFTAMLPKTMEEVQIVVIYSVCAIPIFLGIWDIVNHFKLTATRQ